MMMHMNYKRTPPSPMYGTQWGSRYNNKAPSKVVTIPVHFVGSERSRSESARRIQRVARGYLVRKSVKKMVAMRVELEGIEKKVVSDPETVEAIRREEKERVRVGESIMSLLLRLDSVRALDCSALRDLRKSLIKRAIALQELVDQLVSVGPTHHHVAAAEVEDGEAEKMEALRNEENMEEDGGGKCVGEESVGTSLVKENSLVKEEEEEEGQDIRGEEHEEGNKMEALGGSEENCLEKEEEEGQVGMREEHGEAEKMETLRNEKKMEKVQEKEGGEGKCVGGGEELEEGEKMEALVDSEVGICVGEESVGTSLVEEEDCVVKEEEGGIGIACEEEEEESCKGGGNRELLERMVEDNEKMMEMMAQLFERNEMQTRLLTSLTQRVEQLERAFSCVKLRRKNKKRRDVHVRHKQQTDPKNGCTCS